MHPGVSLDPHLIILHTYTAFFLCQESSNPRSVPLAANSATSSCGNLTMSNAIPSPYADDEDNSALTFRTARASSFDSTANTDVFLEERGNQEDEVTMLTANDGANGNVLCGDGDGSISGKGLKSGRPRTCSRSAQGDSLRLQHYLLQKLRRQVHVGDNGRTYLAELKHNTTPTLYAIKVMRRDDSRKLWAVDMERNVLTSLDHPFLPNIYAAIDSKLFTFLVMDFCPRGDLGTLLQRNHLREDVARFYAAEVLLAMDYLHAHGVIYRGLEPENVLIKADGHVMLSNFDHAIWARHSLPTTSSRNTSSTSCFGRFLRHVPDFGSSESHEGSGGDVLLAPEVIKGEEHDATADWYTYGVFLYELLFRMKPPNDDRMTCVNVIAAQRRLKFPKQPVVSPAARDLLRRLLRKDPKRRLGHNGGGAEVRQHAFFQGTNFGIMEQRAHLWVTPPELPKF